MRRRELIFELVVVAVAAIPLSAGRIAAAQVPPGAGEGACCQGGVGPPPPLPPGPGAGAGSGGGGSHISTWAVGVPGGGVRAPAGVVCTPWRHAADISPDLTVADFGTVAIDPDGVHRNLYYRDCGGDWQYVWVRDEPPEPVARIALSDLQHRLIDAPVPELSPSTVGYVNLETWLATDDPGTLSVTATIPGLSVTATATVVSTTWTTGDTGDTGDDIIVCDGVGVAWTPSTPDDEPAPCGHTYSAHGSEVLGSEPFTITATHTWHVTWRASTGESGDLGTINGPTTTLTYEVREIQTIGIQG